MPFVLHNNPDSIPGSITPTAWQKVSRFFYHVAHPPPSPQMQLTAEIPELLAAAAELLARPSMSPSSPARRASPLLLYQIYELERRRFGAHFEFGCILGRWKTYNSPSVEREMYYIARGGRAGWNEKRVPRHLRKLLKELQHLDVVVEGVRSKGCVGGMEGARNFDVEVATIIKAHGRLF